MRVYLLKFLTNCIILPLAKLSYKLKYLAFKRALNLQPLLTLRVKYQLRLRIPEARLEGYDAELDRIIHLATFRLNKPEIFSIELPDYLFPNLDQELKNTYQSLKEEYERKKEDVDPIVEQIGTRKEIKETVERYHLLQHFIETHSPNSNSRAAEYHLQLARQLNPNTTPLLLDNLYTLERQTRKDLNDLRELISDREALKISLSLNNAASFISVISSFFMLTGYLYNHFLLNAFGIEVSKYFGLSDYLASSIEGIRYSVSGAAVGLLVLFFVAHSTSRMSPLQMEHERQSAPVKYWPYLFFLLLGSIGVNVIAYYLNDQESFYDSTYTLIFLLTIHFAPKLSRKYFKEPLTALFILVFIASFSGHMFASVGKEIYRFKHYDFSKLNRYEVGFSDRLPVGERELVLLAGNSDYLFFLDRLRNPIIVPKREILYLRQH